MTNCASGEFILLMPIGSATRRRRSRSGFRRLKLRDASIGMFIIVILWFLYAFWDSITFASVVDLGRCGSPDGTCNLFLECMVRVFLRG